MIFTFNKWDEFCKKLSKNGILSIPAKCVNSEENFLVLKHDVETDVNKAYTLAKIEAKYGHKGSYYVQAYLLKDDKNIDLLKQMQSMGHEISYHYDVLDSSKGDIKKADIEFLENKELFKKNGFKITTVCQHGNPIVERVGYTSNRDFFRNENISNKYCEISDIMVNFKEKYSTDYSYYSDAGRKFKFIFDPINNDVVNSDDKNIEYENLNELIAKISKQSNAIVSTHPHRWTNSALVYITKTCIFKIVKMIAKILVKIPLLKKIMSKYYYLAKKI